MTPGRFEKPEGGRSVEVLSSPNYQTWDPGKVLQLCDVDALCKRDTGDVQEFFAVEELKLPKGERNELSSFGTLIHA